MKLAVNENTINPNTSNVGITVNSLTYSMIIDGIYTNKLNSTIREISTNARDSHIEAGNLDSFDIFIEPFSDGISSKVRIRDYGTGLTEEEAKTFLCTLNESSKRESNTAIGCFGIGSKSIFTVTDNYQYFCHKGDTTTFISFNRENKSTPSYEIISYPNESEREGVEVVFECNYSPLEILKAIKEELMFFDILPNVYISTASDPEDYVLTEGIFPKVEDKGDYFIVHSSDNVDYNYVIIGTVKYKYLLSGLINSSRHHYSKCSYFLKFNTEDGLTFDISRENITSNPHNSKIIKEKIEKVSQEVSDFIHSNIEDYYDIIYASYLFLSCLTHKSYYILPITINNIREMGLNIPNRQLNPIKVEHFKRYAYDFAQNLITWDRNRIKEIESYSQLAEYLNIPVFKNFNECIQLELLEEIAKGNFDTYIQKSRIFSFLYTLLDPTGIDPKIRAPHISNTDALKDVVIFYHHKPSYYPVKDLENDKLFRQSLLDDKYYVFVQIPLRDQPILVDILEQLSEMFDFIKFHQVSEETASKYSFIPDWFKPKQKKVITVSLSDEESSTDIEVSSKGIPLRTNLNLTYYLSSAEFENPTCVAFFKLFDVSPNKRKPFIYLDDFPLDESQRKVFGKFLSTFSDAVVIFSQDVAEDSFSLLELTLEKAPIDKFIVMSDNKDLFSNCKKVSVHSSSLSESERTTFFNHYFSYSKYLSDVKTCKEVYKILCENYSSDTSTYDGYFVSNHLTGILDTVEVDSTDIHKRNVQVFMKLVATNIFSSNLYGWRNSYPEDLSMKAIAVFFLIQASPFPGFHYLSCETMLKNNPDIVDKLYDFFLSDKIPLLSTMKPKPIYTVQDIRDIYEFTFKKSNRDVSSSESE